MYTHRSLLHAGDIYRNCEFSEKCQTEENPRRVRCRIRQKEKGISEEDLKRNILVNLNPRECLVRLFANGKFYPSFKGKTVDV